MHVLLCLHTAVTASPLMADDTLLRLLLDWMHRCRSDGSPLPDGLRSLLNELVHGATPVQRPLFLSTGVMPTLLDTLELTHPPGSRAHQANWQMVQALVDMLRWPECSVQPNQLHPFCLQLLQSGVLPRLEGESSVATLKLSP